MFLVLIGWVIFMLETPGEIFNYIKNMFSGQFIDNGFIFMISNYWLIIIACIAFSLPIHNRLKMPKGKLANAVYTVVYILIFLLSVMYIVDNTFNPFLYFRF